jgi:hypothetical protein
MYLNNISPYRILEIKQGVSSRQHFVNCGVLSLTKRYLTLTHDDLTLADLGQLNNCFIEAGLIIISGWFNTKAH